MEITEELKAKALSCKTADELLALATENGMELSPEEANLIMQNTGETPEGELCDEELEGISGGAAGCKRNAYETVYFRTQEEVKYIFEIGQVLESFIGNRVGNETCTARIIKRQAIYYQDNDGWCDVYDIERISGSSPMTCYMRRRSCFEK